MPTDLYRADEVREFDRVAIEDLGIPGSTLMERAARAVFEALRRNWPRARRITVACGHGNNGGDGFLLAALAARAGLEVTVWFVGETDRLAGDTAAAYRALCESSVDVTAACDETMLGASDVLVDALLGTGLARAVSARWASAIDALDNAPAPVLALDIPSGLHADSGCVLGVAARAAMTVTFIGLKRGMFTGAGPAVCGDVVFDDLGVPQSVYEHARPSARLLRLDQFSRSLAPRRRDAHKGAFGHVLVVGGDEGLGGAVRLAAEAAARSGAGLVTLATRASHAAAITAQRPELMATGIEEGASLERLLDRATVLAVGPGLGQSDWARDMLAAALASGKPLVLDADALNLLAAADVAPTLEAPTVLTPHPGEAARLLGVTSACIQEDRFAAVEALRQRWGAVVALKGAGTLVCGGAQPIGVCRAGNPGMATGGMGDVLTGVIAALMAQGAPAALAAGAGVCAHAEAADRAAAGGERGMLAGDVIECLRAVLNP